MTLSIEYKEVIFVATILIAAALSADSVIFGLSFGIRKIKIPLYSLFIMSVTGFLSVGGGFFLGELIYDFLPVGEMLGGFILVGLGMWLICGSDDSTRAVINHPEAIDGNDSRIIEPIEAVITGFALSIDSVSVCIGLGASGTASPALPFLTAVFQAIFLYIGALASKKVRLNAGADFITLASGIVIMLAGIYKLTPLLA